MNTTHPLLSLVLAMLVTAATVGGIDQLANERHTVPTQATTQATAGTASHS